MDYKILDFSKRVFAHSILVSRKWEVVFNRSYPTDDLTLKQFMMLLVIENAFETDPTIKQISSQLSTSHQNVKALLQQLEKKEFVELYSDPDDKRVTRIKTTNTKADYWKGRNVKDAQILMSMFEGIPIEDLEVTSRTMEKLDAIASKMLL